MNFAHNLFAGGTSNADFQSAVPQTCTLLAARKRVTDELTTVADCKSAVQQIENLRYAQPG